MAFVETISLGQHVDYQVDCIAMGCRFCVAACGLAIIAFLTSTAIAVDPVFSGPQAGEALPGFEVKVVAGPHQGETVDPIKLAEGGPVMLSFLHKKTRPAFGMLRTLSKYAVTRKDRGLTTMIVFLADDRSDAERWLGQVRRYFADDVMLAVSNDGADGPGNYGLNRLVQTTVLVGDDGKTVANFAITDPQLQADGPGILKAIVGVTGGGDVPDVKSLQDAGMQMRRRAPRDTNP
ncbi:hypothetical protein Mal65_29520 [Crateriforma conspicua]|nr:hypothetical protein Mal65_29520 [Crateriforma conspicua]